MFVKIVPARMVLPMIALLLLAGCQGLRPGSVATPLPSPVTPVITATLEPTATPTAPVVATATPSLTPTLAANNTPAVTMTPEQPEPVPTGDTRDREVIAPANATELEPVGDVSANGAVSFSWLEAATPALALATENEIVLYEIAPPAEMEDTAASTPVLMASAPGQPVVAWAAMDNSLHVWNKAAGQDAVTLGGERQTVTGLALAPGGGFLAVASQDQVLEVWDTLAGVQVREWTVPAWLTDLTYSPDGRLLAGTDIMNFTVRIFDAASGAEVRTLTWTESASPVLYKAVFSPDWLTLAWVARGTVQFMQVDSGQLGPVLSHEDFVSDVAWSPDSSLLATAAGATVEGNFVPVVIIWDAGSGEPVHTLVQSTVAVELAFSPDGRELANLDAEGKLQIWAVTR